MTAKKIDVVAEAKQAIAATQKSQRWFNKVAPQHRVVLEQIREAWLAGELGKARRSAARVISRILNDRGISDAGVQGVDAWLADLS